MGNAWSNSFQPPGTPFSGGAQISDKEANAGEHGMACQQREQQDPGAKVQRREAVWPFRDVSPSMLEDMEATKCSWSGKGQILNSLVLGLDTDWAGQAHCQELTLSVTRHGEPCNGLPS